MNNKYISMLSGLVSDIRKSGEIKPTNGDSLKLESSCTACEAYRDNRAGLNCPDHSDKPPQITRTTIH